METQSTRRPSPAMIVAMLALFISITGTAVGLPGKNKVNSQDVKDETLLSQDLRDGEAVGSSDVIDDSLASGDIADGTLEAADYGAGSVTSGDIADGTLEPGDFGFGSVSSAAIADSAVSSSELADDAVGINELQEASVAGVKIAPGAVGADKIAPGAVGSEHLASVETVTSAPTSLGSQAEGNNDYLFGVAIADCPEGTVVVSGGGTFAGDDPGGAGGDELQAIAASRMLGNSWGVLGVSDVDDDVFHAFAHCLNLGGQ